MRVAIISHTQHYKNSQGEIVGWGPTIKEINHLSESINSIIHIAPFHKENPPNSALPYDAKNITFLALKSSGGKGLNKLSILITAPYNLYKIIKGIKDVDYIQFRAPTGIGIYVLPLLKIFYSNKYWVKYAGNWKDLYMPFGNKVQKVWLQKFTSLKTKVTVNGFWKNERSNILPFENPCLDVNDRLSGENLLKDKRLDKKLTFCFVGALNKHKGVDVILETLALIDSRSIKEIHFVGDSIEKEKYINRSKTINYKIHFHGFLSKKKISDVYKKSHFILLPSKSEGFPKVIAEAMNFSCIPIVTNMSCINQYIIDNKNGFLLSKPSIDELYLAMNKAIQLTNNQFINWTKNNYYLVNKFTYKYYIKRLKEEIFIYK